MIQGRNFQISRMPLIVSSLIAIAVASVLLIAPAVAQSSQDTDKQQGHTYKFKIEPSDTTEDSADKEDTNAEGSKGNPAEANLEKSNLKNDQHSSENRSK